MTEIKFVLDEINSNTLLELEKFFMSKEGFMYKTYGPALLDSHKPLVDFVTTEIHITFNKTKGFCIKNLIIITRDEKMRQEILEITKR